MPRPTQEQLDKYMDLVVDGQDPEDVLDLLWPDDEPEPAKPTKPTVMVTEFPDGVVIGWDHCTLTNSGCGKHVRLCTCKGGPKELKVFELWRTGAKAMPDYAAASRAAAAKGVPTSAALPEGTTGVVVATQDVTANEVPCVLGKHLVPLDQADKNDDGTYSCFTCQEAGTQRGVQVDG